MSSKTQERLLLLLIPMLVFVIAFYSYVAWIEVKKQHTIIQAELVYPVKLSLIQNNYQSCLYRLTITGLPSPHSDNSQKSYTYFDSCTVGDREGFIILKTIEDND